MMERLANIPGAFWTALLEMAPYLLVGFAAAGAMSVLLPSRWVRAHLGGGGVAPVFKAAALGVPLPLCSCSVIPVAASLRQSGASKGATLSFLLSTPQTGADSILVTYGMLGGVFAIFRPILALVSGLVGGLAVAILDRKDRQASAPVAAGDPTGRVAAAKEEGRGTGLPGNSNGAAGGKGRLRRGLEYGFVTLPEDIGRAVLGGLLIAAVISALVPADSLSRLLPPGPGQIALLMLVGIPVYVCATASVPIAAALILTGVSPGAALAFLVTGAGTNAATVATIWKLMGRRTTLIYLATLAAAALLGGMGLDWTLRHLAATVPAASHAGHVHGEHGANWAQWSAAIVLLGMLATGIVRPLLRRWRSRAAFSASGASLTLGVTGMTCEHCAATVQAALRACAGVRSADVDLDAGRARVAGTNLDAGALCQAVRQAGYAAAEIPREPDISEG